ncbi:hypothetical protein HJG60_010321 [Phyllostomus discolor]|uniref:Uncharacterized protein n=1 Tax=Phyllostomus discolor TaxID=89673 RepID=A0A834AZV7_9CHIR|nr:hypothetical protein HJG60_010321 [Phyllostomus discolor]
MKKEQRDYKQSERKKSRTDAHLLERNHREYRLFCFLLPPCSRRFPAQCCRLDASQPATTSEPQAGRENFFFLFFFPSSFLLPSLLPHPPLSLLHILRKTIAFPENTSRISPYIFNCPELGHTVPP